MKNVKSLVMALQKPVRIFISNSELEGSNLIIDNKILSPPEFPLWEVCPDILINSRKEFIGVTYFVGNNERELVEKLTINLDNQIVRYVKSLPEKTALPYLKDKIEPNHLEIRWSLTDVYTIETAQLSSDYWYYDVISNEEYEFVAFGLESVDKILYEYKLNFPNDVQLPLFQPRFV